MTTWILAALGLYLGQIYLSALIYFPTEGALRHLGGRDDQPEKGKLTKRSDRALVNMKENLPLFFVPALLTYVVPGANLELAILGAQVFFLGRLAYVPLYLTGIPGLRSLAYTVAIVGNVVVAWSLFSN
jgi:uncharacterized MAPEG superfamily protein